MLAPAPAMDATTPVLGLIVTVLVEFGVKALVTLTVIGKVSEGYVASVRRNRTGAFSPRAFRSATAAVNVA